MLLGFCCAATTGGELENGRNNGAILLVFRRSLLLLLVVVVILIVLLLFAAARSLALSSARASQKALCVSRLSFLHQTRNGLVKQMIRGRLNDYIN